MDTRPTTYLKLPPVCRDCTARAFGICAMLTPHELDYLATNARQSRHEAGEALAVEGGRLTGYANIKAGVVKLSRMLRDGRQQLVGLLSAPDLLGRLFGTENLLTAEAASDVELCRVPKPVLEQLVAASPRLQHWLLQQSLDELDRARDWMLALGRKTATERVASLLLHIAARSSPASTSTIAIDLPLSRSDIADFLGLTIETVSREIGKLRRDGIIAVTGRRHVLVYDAATLRQRAG